MPMYQNSSEVMKYVVTAKTSHISGLLNCGQTQFWLGSGKRYQSIHGRPVWKATKVMAQITAKIVIASARGLMPVRHVWRNRDRIAEISVPAWPIPIQNTKLTMSKAQATGIMLPHT